MVNERNEQSRLVRVASAAAIMVAAIAVTFIAVGGVYAKGPSSAAAYYYGGKITICHHAGPHGKTVTITVSQSALPAHLRHGDTVGPCP